MTVTGAEQYVTRYEYHPNNWLLKEVKTEKGAMETVVYQYDANGNQCYRKWERLEEKGSARKKAPQLSFSPHKDNTALDLREYDGFGSLILVFRDHIRTDYRYRPDGLRHSKAVDDKGVTTVTRHHWDRLGMVMETGENGNIKARYLRGGELLAQQIDGGTFYYLFDGHGNVTQRIGADGNAAPEYRYDAFGNQREPVATDPNPFRFCGEYFDAETGEVYLRNRSYSARSGRFTSEDPMRDGLNWYAYCGNNPVRFVDPLGLAYESEWSKSVSAFDYKRPNTSNTSWLTSNTSDRGWSVGYINQRLYGDAKVPKDSAPTPNWAGLDWARSVSSSSSGDRLVRQSRAVDTQHSLKRYLSTRNVDREYENFAKAVNYDPWAQESYITDLFSQSVANWDFDSIKFDGALVARLLFHEDATAEGMYGIAWTLRNNMDRGYDIRYIIKEWYMKQDSDWAWGLEEYFRPSDWLSNHTEGGDSHGTAAGTPTRNSWIMAVHMAQGVLNNDLGTNPFIGTAAPDATNVVQYVGKFGASDTIKNSPNRWIHIGNSYFYYDGVRPGS